jgi:hypothetical protein
VYYKINVRFDFVRTNEKACGDLRSKASDAVTYGIYITSFASKFDTFQITVLYNRNSKNVCHIR